MAAYSLDPSRNRRRGVALLLVLGIHAALLLLLWTLAPARERFAESRRGALEVIMLPEARDPAPDADPRPRRADERAAAKPAEPEPQKPAPPKPAAAPERWSFELIPGMEKFDLAQLPRGTPAAGAAAPTSAGTDGGGAIPGRERLFPAQWQRKPTRAELAAYLPTGLRQTGFGVIACRTVENFRVEDCEELDQSPGTGLARAVRQAAWQFRVLPPRIGGRNMVGAWVRIRIDYTEGVAD